MSSTPGWLPGGRVHRFGADHLDVEQVETVVEQVDAVVDGAREAEHMAVAVRPFRPAVQRPLQVGAAEAAGFRREEHEIGGDADQHEAPDGAAEGQRNPHHQFQDGQIAAFLLAQPVGFGGLFLAHGAGGVRLPAATSRSAARTVKAMAPLGLGVSEKSQRFVGADRAEELGIADLPVHTGAAERVLGEQDGAVEQHDAGHDGATGEMAGKGRVVGRHLPAKLSLGHALPGRRTGPAGRCAAACRCCCAAAHRPAPAAGAGRWPRSAGARRR
jgi:hypothetical protein